MTSTLLISPPLLAVIVLVLGATVTLLLVQPLSARPAAASAIGVVCALVAAAMSLLGERTIYALAMPALCGVAAIALLLIPTLDLQERVHTAESTALILLGTAGALALASAGTLIEAVVGQETLALSAVTLVALTRGERPLEAAFKYFVLGAISLAALTYGVGLVYLGTGSFGFPTAQDLASNGLVVAGVALVAVGFGFEMAIFPFHWGAVDAYTAASPALGGWVMSASKLAAAYALGRLVVQAGVPINGLLIWLGSLTIIWGTFGAIAQRELRRMLAYSAITHAGFIALAVGSGADGPVTAAFYAASYASMAMLVFAALSPFGADPMPMDRLGSMSIGFGRALALALGLFSLAGIPPTPGFWAKLAVLVAAWHSAGPLPTLIAIAGGVFSVLYYLRPIPDLFAAIRAGAPAAVRRPGSAAGVAVAAVAVVALGLFPGIAWGLARSLQLGS